MGDAKTVRYFLDILAPGQRKQTLVQFSALTPFQAIHVGDVLHSQSMLDSADSMAWLRVVGVVHRIWDLTEHISHLTTVYTTAVSAREALDFWGDGGAEEVEELDVVPLDDADVMLEP